MPFVARMVERERGWHRGSHSGTRAHIINQFALYKVGAERKSGAHTLADGRGYSTYIHYAHTRAFAGRQ